MGLTAPVSAGTAAETATGDAAFLRAMLDAEAALVRALAETGRAPASAADAVALVTADTGRFDARSIALRARAGGNPVIPLVADIAARVSEVDPAAAEFVHRGATSQDIVDTAWMLVAARSRAVLIDDLDATAGALALLAVRHRDTAMAARTLTQHAVPTTFGLKAAGWRALVLDARDRLAGVRLPAQLGGAAGTLAAWTAEPPAVRQADGPDDDPFGGPDDGTGMLVPAAYARALGLAEPVLPWHVLRTPVVDLGAALAFTAGALGKIAEDVLTLSRTEIAELAEGTGGGSSAMPHKANPVGATLIAATARQIPALAGVLAASLVAADERPPGAWHAEWIPLRDALRLTGGAASAARVLVSELRVDPERMRANLALTGGLVATEGLVAAYAPVIGRTAARAAIERVAARVTGGAVTLIGAIDDEPALKGVFDADRLAELIDPARHTGAAGSLVDRALRRRPADRTDAHADGPDAASTDTDAAVPDRAPAAAPGKPRADGPAEAPDDQEGTTP
ncbi:lyase family protein [Streptodolium elevatio]|uniref:Lyase family protein n=1 Tax=Streptodolium elevatio TaxID=3157996 RepID=A0ABV3DI05_9ACTN